MKCVWLLFSFIAACACDGVNEINYLPAINEYYNQGHSNYGPFGKGTYKGQDKQEYVRKDEIPLLGVIELQKFPLDPGAMRVGNTLPGGPGLPSINNAPTADNPNTTAINGTAPGISAQGITAPGQGTPGNLINNPGAVPQGNYQNQYPVEKRYLIKGLTGRFGLGFQRRNYFSGGMKFPITPEILEPVGRRQLIKEKYYEPLPRIFYN